MGVVAHIQNGVENGIEVEGGRVRGNDNGENVGREIEDKGRKEEGE